MVTIKLYCYIAIKLLLGLFVDVSVRWVFCLFMLCFLKCRGTRKELLQPENDRKRIRSPMRDEVYTDGH